jgi:hypothetical protein
MDIRVSLHKPEKSKNMSNLKEIKTNKIKFWFLIFRKSFYFLRFKDFKNNFSRFQE